MSKPDLPYDYEDLGMTVQELQAKYGEQGAHPHHTLTEYRALTEAQQGGFNGYWDYVFQEIAIDDEVY